MSDLQISWTKETLEFIKSAKTSRGEYHDKNVVLINLKQGNKKGIGEASPLPDLSMDGQLDLEIALNEVQSKIYNGTSIKEILLSLDNFPSVQFALECAWLQLQASGEEIFSTDFTKGISSIPINGLVWMDEISAMEAEMLKKVQEGFRCIKIKVGQHDHDAECRFLEKIRKSWNAFKLELRLDANGAFSMEDSKNKIRDFSRFEIHSLEQPIRAGQWDYMAEICADSKIPVALDEELIGVKTEMAEKLLRWIQPAFIILKPTLLGGFSKCDTWIQGAQKNNIGWWATSALESNVGLGHIAQWVSTKSVKMYQGLGTGALYKNNFPSHLQLIKDEIWYRS
ncbi:MAG: o-succinylbenzoate synthase [Bacteroidetes bacterium]|nr:o-succinylbenzoate synthase [Bacteroidota bacterium]